MLKFLTTDEAAAYLRLSERKLYELVAMAEPAPGGAAGEIGIWSGGRFYSLGRAES